MEPNDKLIPLRIRLPYGSEEEFIERYGSNVARGGVFIATRALKPEGTPLAFEFVLADGVRLLRGEGVVVKIQVDEGGSRSGMTVRFVRLDSPSKAFIDRLLAHRAGQPLPPPPEAPAPTAPEAPDTSAPREATPPAMVRKAKPTFQPPRAPAKPTFQPPPTKAQPAPEPPAPVAEKQAPESAPSRDAVGEQGRLDSADEPPAPEPASAEPVSAFAPPEPAVAATPEPTELSFDEPELPGAATPQAGESEPDSLAAALEQASVQAPPEPVRAVEPAPAPELLVIEEKAVPPEPRPAPMTGLSSDEAKARRRTLLSVSMQPAVVAAGLDELVLGIDLGTTNSRVAVFRGGAASLLPVDREGQSFALPTIVALDEQGQLVVGHAARAQMLRDPSRAVFGAKRLLGRRERSAKVKELAARFPYAIEADENGDAGVRLGDRVHRLPELYARILSELKASARVHLGREVSKAVLCVPAYFNDHQRAALREAGKLAGLDVVRLFNEPSAVALAFGHARGLARKRVLVYDLGGGTFDATVVAITGDDLEVVATGGDNFLGGMDFDTRVASELARLFENREQLRLSASPVTTQRLRDLAEQVKISLSEQEVTPTFLPGVTERNGAPLDLRGDFTREDLERVTAELVERTAQLTLSVLASGSLSFQGLDDVLLVGGQSRAPLVRKRMAELAGKAVRTDVDATAAVALGAAILGHSMVEAARGKPGVTLSEVLSAPIGIGVRGGGMLCVLDRNTRLPAEKTIGLPLREGERVSIAIFQGASARAEENEYLGSLSTGGDRSGEVSLRFAVGADGTLDLAAVAPGGKRFAITLATQDATDEVRAAVLAQAPLPGEPEPPPESKGLLGGIRKLFGRR